MSSPQTKVKKRGHKFMKQWNSKLRLQKDRLKELKHLSIRDDVISSRDSSWFSCPSWLLNSLREFTSKTRGRTQAASRQELEAPDEETLAHYSLTIDRWNKLSWKKLTAESLSVLKKNSPRNVVSKFTAKSRTTTPSVASELNYRG